MLRFSISDNMYCHLSILQRIRIFGPRLTSQHRRYYILTRFFRRRSFGLFTRAEFFAHTRNATLKKRVIYCPRENVVNGHSIGGNKSQYELDIIVRFQPVYIGGTTLRQCSVRCCTRLCTGLFSFN